MRLPPLVPVLLAFFTLPLRTLDAMSVQPPTFPELVAEATTVARARIVSVTCRTVAGLNGRSVIKTFVTFATLTSLKGAPAPEFTLAFLGGTEKGERWVVAGMPSFAVGEEAFIFATGESSVCPLVGAMHGRYHILNDAATNRRYVARDNHEPLTSTDEVVSPIEPGQRVKLSSAQITAALSPEDFEARIAAEAKHPSRPAVAR